MINKKSFQAINLPFLVSFRLTFYPREFELGPRLYSRLNFPPESLVQNIIFYMLSRTTLPIVWSTVPSISVRHHQCSIMFARDVMSEYSSDESVFPLVRPLWYWLLRVLAGVFHCCSYSKYMYYEFRELEHYPSRRLNWINIVLRQTIELPKSHQRRLFIYEETQCRNALLTWLLSS